MKHWSGLLATGLLTRNGARPSEVLKRTWAEIRAEDVFGRAAQLAYYFFLALFPFLICIVATLSLFGTADRGRTLLFEFASRFLPGPAFELVTSTFSQILAAGGPLKMSLGVIASLWSASLGMSAIMDTLNAAYKVRETRSLVKQYGIAIALTLGMGVLVVVATLSVIAGDDIASRLPIPYAAYFAWRLVEWPLAGVLLLLGFAVTYYFAPNLEHPKWHWITPGAVAGVLLLIAVWAGMRIYLHFWSTFTTTYGSLGGVIVLLLCFYLGGVAVLAGGALNGVLEDLARHRPWTDIQL